MPYTSKSWSQLQTDLFDRLGDQLFYSNTGAYPEVASYLRESLRVWNALANFYHERVVFTTTANVPWYSLPAVATNPPNILNFTVRDVDLIAEMQYQLMESQPLNAEPVNPTVWLGTDMFNLPMLVAALQRRRDQFLLETAVTLNRSIISGAISSEGRMDLPETVIDVLRAAWVDAGSGLRNHLWRRDEWAANAYSRGWSYNPASKPSAYSLILTPPIRVQFIPPPSTVGSVDLLSTHNGAQLNPAAGVLIGVPDDFTWAIKYGAISDLIANEGQGRDPARAQYCQQRFQEGVSLASQNAEILHAQVNGVPVPVVSLHEMDAQSPGWHNTSEKPRTVAVYRDMVALNPAPDGIYSVTLDVIRPAPIPVSGADFVNLGPEQLDAILSYAHHIASFKEGGAEFAATQQQYQSMIRLAADHNRKLEAMAIFRNALEDRSTREQERRPRREQLLQEVASG